MTNCSVSAYADVPYMYNHSAHGLSKAIALLRPHALWLFCRRSIQQCAF